MNREERERMVDRLLDDALAPQEIEPRIGLEQRILANLRAQPERRAWWAWMGVPVLAAALLIVIGVMVTRRPQPLTAPVVVEHRPATPTEPTVVRPPAVVAKHRHPSLKAAPISVVALATPAPIAPRQPVFAPARLTEAERALVAVLRSNPEEAKVVAERQAETQLEAAEFMEQAFNPR
jgi:hypothetical protein